MAWNEPGGGQRDPWGRGGNKNPDFDAILKRLQQHFKGLGDGGPKGIGILVLAVLLAWLLLGSWTVINARQVGVVLRFGAYSRTLPPGFHLVFPRPISQVMKVEMTRVRSVSDTVQMLTKDENIIQVNFNVQYQVNDAKKYLFSMQNPDLAVRQAAEAAVRSVVGSSTMDTLLSGQGATMVIRTSKALQKMLDSYGAGLRITEVNFQNIAPPSEVKAAFDDVNKAREDRQRIENVAKAYASKIIPEARGQAASIIAGSEGYKASRIARARGDTQRFLLLLKEYQLAPKVTGERLWLETIEDVFKNNSKIIDGGNARNLINLPSAWGGATTPIAPVAGAVMEPLPKSPTANGTSAAAGG